MLKIESYIEEGNSVTIDYSLTDEDGAAVISVDKLEYKLSDGVNAVIDWTEVINPDLPSGSIKIPSANNRIVAMSDRYFTLHAVYGDSESFKTTRYCLKDSPNVSISNP